MTTEVVLWKALERNAPASLDMTRIEVSTALGVSDVEYVSRKRCGWIELKCATVTGVDAVPRLRCDFTTEQQLWLLRHHRPPALVSWLLMGIVGKRTFSGFVLVDAITAPSVARGLLTFGQLVGRKNCVYFTDIAECVSYIGA